MLINCPECNNKISDKSAMCVHCGCPREFFSNKPMDVKPKIEKSVDKPKTIRKHRKLPNGYGSIHKLSGKRRNPYAVYPPVRIDEYSDDGKKPSKKALAYCKTYNEAYEILAYYNATHGKSTSGVRTFSQVYEMMIEEMESDTSDKKKSSSTFALYRANYKRCEPLYNLPMDKIFKAEMEQILADCDKGYSTHNGIKVLFSAVFKYAIENGIVEKDYSKFVHVKKENDNEKGDIFEEDEIAKLWKYKDNKDIQICLILLYSGMRISELKKTTIDLDNGTFQGGVKTKTSKERTIPIHDSIKCFVEEFNQDEFNLKDWRNKSFYPIMEEIGLSKSKNGKKHTPHDFRHTFSWLADKYKLDEFSKHLIMGHTVVGVEKSVYGHRTIEELKKEINKIKTH